jgi:O-antigen/teichoic acid export membrane protein
MAAGPGRVESKMTNGRSLKGEGAGNFGKFVRVGLLYLFGIPLAILTNIFLARCLTVSDFGAFNYVISVANMLAVFVSLGMPTLLIREVSIFLLDNAAEQCKGLISAAYRLAAVTSIVIAILMVSYLLWFKADAGWPQYLPIALAPLLGVSALRIAILKGMSAPFLGDFQLQILQPALLLGGYFVLSQTIGSSLQHALIWYFLTAVIIFFLASLFIKAIYPKSLRQARPDFQSWPKWRASLMPLLAINLVDILSTQAAILILGWFSDNQQIAYFKIAERAAFLSLVPFFVAASVMGPQYVSSIKKGDLVQLRQISAQAARFTTLASAVGTVLMVVFGRQMLLHVFGQSYMESAYLPLVIMVIAQTIYTSMGSSSQMLAMAGYEKMGLRGQLVGVSLMLIVSLLTVKNFGATGVACAVALGAVSANFTNMMTVRRRLGVSPAVF